MPLHPIPMTDVEPVLEAEPAGREAPGLFLMALAVVVSLAGKDADLAALLRLIEQDKVGGRIAVELVRKGRRLTVTLILGRWEGPRANGA